MTNSQRETAMKNALAKCNSPGVSFYDAARSEGLDWHDVKAAWDQSKNQKLKDRRS